jgi:hypothetical protein
MSVPISDIVDVVVVVVVDVGIDFRDNRTDSMYVGIMSLLNHNISESTE